MLRHFRCRLVPSMLAVAFVATASLIASDAQAQCSSMDPADWPPPAKPYFMVVADTSGSMTACTNPQTDWPTTCDDVGGGTPNSCGYQPLRVNDAKCALENTINAFGGEVNFGLSTFSTYISSCPATCDWDEFWTGSYWYRYAWQGCNIDYSDQCDGASIVVPLLQDPPVGPPDNFGALLGYVDHNCGDDEELFAMGGTPLGGSLDDMYTYFDTSFGGYTSPLSSSDPACRSVNVILMTDGGESCGGDPVTAAQNLWNGVTKGSTTFKIYTHVIAFNVDDPADLTLANNIHKMGQCGQLTGACASAVNAYQADDEVTLALRLADIITSAIRPEVCNNEDDNCNTCVDEGYVHYCNAGRTPVGRTVPPTGPDQCCDWGSDLGERDLCLADYEASIASNPPDGDLALLPCTSAAQQADWERWLCYDPTEICDDVDNNCDGTTDEGFVKCPNCPVPEQCDDGIDNDCNGAIDEGCQCVYSPETCDGCDNDCDGVVDNDPGSGFPGLPCGLPSTAPNPPTPWYCEGTRACLPPVAASGGPGTCEPGRGYDTTCTYGLPPPLPVEICDGWDNDCNGLVDDNPTDVGGSCQPTGWDPTWVVGGTAPCQLGTEACVNGALQCQGGVLAGTEVCDNIDNDCTGVPDDDPNMPGVGNSCGTTIGPCTLGTTACVGGAITCTGGIQPGPETCNNVDDDCDGTVDNNLTDAPPPGQTGCWEPQPGATSCSFAGLVWDPPPGATCYDAGTLHTPTSVPPAPCHTGNLICDGANGWICFDPVPPTGEVCDDIDNNCNGSTDEGTLPGEGDPCGTDVGQCVAGITDCQGGIMTCFGETPPAPEICDGLDNDCDSDQGPGYVDEGATDVGQPCDPPYDTTDYPGPNRILNQPCGPGVDDCTPQDTETGNPILTCVGGIAPSPEVCDGIDNDCDTSIDETGPQPDGINGTENPYQPGEFIGDPCGETEGQCEPGQLGCLNALFACLGAVGPTIERCDCEDNDCDGSTDETQPTPICSGTKDCVVTPEDCVCADLCGSGEYPCATGTKCVTATISGGTAQGQYCVPDYDIICGDCASKTVTDVNNDVVCAPFGTDDPGCLLTPVCECKGLAGCRQPCYDVQCSQPLVCSNFGPTPGECVQDTCYNTGCPGCDRACHDGLCVDNPCHADTCQPDEVCKPSEDFSSYTCVGSCAGVDCDPGQRCQDGQCVAWCDPDCAPGTVCDPSGPTCVPDLCVTDGGANPCVDGSCCDPLTGQCGDCPCSGVVCPQGQVCVDGECVEGGTGGAGGGGAGAAGGAGGAGAAGGGTTGGGPPGPGPQGQEDGVWRQSTGGGGCACELAPERDRTPGWQWLSLMALALGLGARRRRSGVSASDEEGAR